MGFKLLLYESTDVSLNKPSDNLDEHRVVESSTIKRGEFIDPS